MSQGSDNPDARHRVVPDAAAFMTHKGRPGAKAERPLGRTAGFPVPFIPVANNQLRLRRVPRFLLMRFELFDEYSEMRRDRSHEAPPRCRLMASKQSGRRRHPTSEITCLVLDSMPGGRHVATHNDILRCNIGCARCVISARLLTVFGRFEANSRVCLHRPERRRLGLA
jgi:hypothetical protein